MMMFIKQKQIGKMIYKIEVSNHFTFNPNDKKEELK